MITVRHIRKMGEGKGKGEGEGEAGGSDLGVVASCSPLFPAR